jgi:hypothetical protein
MRHGMMPRLPSRRACRRGVRLASMRCNADRASAWDRAVSRPVSCSRWWGRAACEPVRCGPSHRGLDAPMWSHAPLGTGASDPRRDHDPMYPDRTAVHDASARRASVLAQPRTRRRASRRQLRPTCPTSPGGPVTDVRPPDDAADAESDGTGCDWKPRPPEPATQPVHRPDTNGDIAPRSTDGTAAR